MPRNFERRVEVMFPVEAPELKQRICDEILPAYQADNSRARLLQSDGNLSSSKGLQGRARTTFPARFTGSGTNPQSGCPRASIEAR